MRTKQILSSVWFVVLAGLLLLWQPVEVVQPVGPKADQLVIIDIFDGPTGHIYIGPMTTREAEDYRDAEPDVYLFGTTEYTVALTEKRLGAILAGKPSPRGVPPTPP